jgi:hypothetical protein
MSNQNHDSMGRFASGDGSGGKVTNTVRERQALRALVDARKFTQGRTSNRNINPPAMPGDVAHLRGVAAAAAETGAHTVGVHAATMGKTLAQTSAMGATTAKIGGGQ